VTPAHTLVANLVAVLLLGTLAGMAWQRRLSSCWTFTAVLILSAITNRLIVWWPATFYNRQFWVLKELGYAALHGLVMVELCVVGLRLFPRARRLALVAGALTLTASGMMVAVAAAPSYPAQLGVMVARGNIGLAWAFTMLIAVVWRYELPLQPFHRMILLGYVLYLSVYSALLSLVGLLGLAVHRYLAALDPAMFAATIGLWLLAAWEPDRVAATSVQVPARP